MGIVFSQKYRFKQASSIKDCLLDYTFLFDNDD